MSERRTLGELNGPWLRMFKVALAVGGIMTPIALGALGRAWYIADAHTARLTALESRAAASEATGDSIADRLARTEAKLDSILEKLGRIEARASRP